jgi:hypothetical protein
LFFAFGSWLVFCESELHPRQPRIGSSSIASQRRLVIEQRCSGVH